MNEHIVEEWVVNSQKFTRNRFFRKYRLNNRIRRLFAVACCREIWNKITDERSKKAVETAELYADGLVIKDELVKARIDARDAYLSPIPIDAGAAVAYSTTTSNVSTVYHDSFDYKQQGLVIAQMYPTPFDDNWSNPTTKSLAKQIYDNKDFSLMPILADALQDVDCNEEILEHLRSKGPFYKGNYIIDVLTGKRTT